MSTWFNYVATAKILIFGLLAGVTLPALFAVAVRLGDSGDSSDGGSGDQGASVRHPGRIALRWAIFTLLVVMVVVGVLFIARHFVANRIGWQWYDWEGWDDVFDFG